MMDLRGATWFRLSQAHVAYGLACDENGAFLGPIPLVALTRDGRGEDIWRARQIPELNLELGAHYGLPIDITTKAKGLATVAGALNEGNLAKAQIAALHLHLPDLPPLAKGERTGVEIATLAIQLRRTGILKGTFDPAKHPKWPAHAPDSQGGQFKPRDSDGSAEGTNDSGALLADATAPSVLSRDGIPKNLPDSVKDGLDFLNSKVDEPGNASYRAFYNKWKVIYNDTPSTFGDGRYSLGYTEYSPQGSTTTFYPAVRRPRWSEEKFRFLVAHEFAHTLPENAATPQKDRERNANEIAARITGIPIPQEFKDYVDR
jgi:hypothetical protein